MNDLTGGFRVFRAYRDRKRHRLFVASAPPRENGRPSLLDAAGQIHWLDADQRKGGGRTLQ
jgi:hypothetical protein